MKDIIREKAYNRIQDDLEFCISQIWSHLVAYIGIYRLREMDLKNQLLYAFKYKSFDFIKYNYTQEELQHIINVINELGFDNLKSELLNLYT